MDDNRNCPNCGAPFGEARACPYCGTLKDGVLNIPFGTPVHVSFDINEYSYNFDMAINQFNLGMMRDVTNVYSDGGLCYRMATGPEHYSVDISADIIPDGEGRSIVVRKVSEGAGI